MINIESKNYFGQIGEFQFNLNNNKNIIGTGSFGVVKLALHKGTNRVYAVKIIDLKKIENEAELRVIEREIKLHSLLDHPHIIKLWDTLIQDQVIYMIMEYAEKGNLFYHQNNKVRFNQAESFQYFYQCAKAIEYIHNRNIIHRDIKPQNLLLDHSYNIKICDFGWSAEDIYMKRSTFCGTYEYMAPEMILKKPYNFKIDIWGLGILLFQLLHGFAPFRGTSLDSISNQIQKGEYQLNSSLSDEVKDLIKCILQYEAESRPSFKDILEHPWIQKMKLHINSSLIKQHINSQNITDKLCKIGIQKGENQPLSKKKTHKKAESASQIYMPSKDKKNIQINFSINNYELIGLKDKIKKKIEMGKRCKTMTEQSMKKLINHQSILSPPPVNTKPFNQYLQHSPKEKELRKMNAIRSPKGKIPQSRVNTEMSEKIKVLKKKKSIQQTLHKLSRQYLNKKKNN